MQELNLQVKTTKDFLFKPTTIQITIMNVRDVDGEKVFPVQTRLVQKTERGEIAEVSMFEFTKEQLDAVLTGFDFELNQPIASKEALAVILSSFNLELDEA